MRLPHRFALAAPLLTVAAACAESAPAPERRSAPQGAAVTLATRSATTVTGQPLAAAPSPFEAVISVTELPAGGILPMHRHPWPRYVYIDRGSIAVRYEGMAEARVFHRGEGIAEAVDAWHEGRVAGDEPVRLIVFDQVPPGQTNVVRR